MGLGGFFVDIASGADAILKNKRLTMILMGGAAGVFLLISFIAFMWSLFMS
jgi:hypothetical protein